MSRSVYQTNPHTLQESYKTAKNQQEFCSVTFNLQYNFNMALTEMV